MGKFEAYKEHEEEWESYIERFEMYVEANGIEDGAKKAHLVSLIGSKTYAVF